MLVGLFTKGGFVADDAERVLHDDGFGFTFIELVVRLAGAENLLVDIVINRGETSDENRVYGSYTSIRRSDNFAGTHAVADGFKNERHAKTCLEAEMPIFGISI